jgi:hypothetical protein
VEVGGLVVVVGLKSERVSRVIAGGILYNVLKLDGFTEKVREEVSFV